MSVKNSIGFLSQFRKWINQTSEKPVKFISIEAEQPTDTRKLENAVAKFNAKKRGKNEQ